MKGTWNFHQSLISLITPVGLHREWYKLKGNNLDFDEDDIIFVKYRRRHDFRDKWY